VLEFQGSLKGKSPKDARVEAKTWLEKLEIADWADKKVEELSKGMQQKIQFAAAVLGKPPILILDEPFSGMDPVNQNLFKDQILDLNRQGTTIVFSTHQMETAERLCKEIALINKGQLVLPDQQPKKHKSAKPVPAQGSPDATPAEPPAGQSGTNGSDR